MFGKDSYEEDVKLFKKVLSTQADELLSNEALAVTYIGRATYPFYSKFAKKLNGLTNKINTTIYYVDSANFSYKIQKDRTLISKYSILIILHFLQILY
jgi:predicted bacteriocin transport accessory protein